MYNSAVNIQTWISIVSAVVAIVSAVFAGLRTREASRARQAAERNAAAAEESAKTAREALEVGRRAWITVQPKIVHSDSSTSVPLRVELPLHNGGDTPGLNVRGDVRLSLWPCLPAELRFEDARDFGALGPKDRVMAVVNLDLDCRDDVERVPKKELFTYLWGRVRYRDVFGQEHETAWTYIHDRQSDQFLVWAGEQYNYST